MPLNALAPHPCRACSAPLDFIFADLGVHPIANDLCATHDEVQAQERFPLRVAYCSRCHLVQLADDLPATRLFRADYVYQSSVSKSFVAHAEAHVEELINTYHLDHTHHIVEIASNDGYLLQFFKKKGIPVTGIEPAASVAALARERHGIPTIEAFFGADEAERFVNIHGQADIIIANNVLAHVPELFDFVLGIKTLLRKGGRARIEFPHLLNLLQFVQFDTNYHEHYSYLSLIALIPLFDRAWLTISDVETLPVHGGSLRITVQHKTDDITPSDRMIALIEREKKAGLHDKSQYQAFASTIKTINTKLHDIINHINQEGKLVAAYGAPAKGNTLLNAAALDTSHIAFTVDKALSKQGRFLPGSGIPILSPDALLTYEPDVILILPWNLKDEIINEVTTLMKRPQRFIIPIPEPVLITASYSQ